MNTNYNFCLSLCQSLQGKYEKRDFQLDPASSYFESYSKTNENARLIFSVAKKKKEKTIFIAFKGIESLYIEELSLPFSYNDKTILEFDFQITKNEFPFLHFIELILEGYNIILTGYHSGGSLAQVAALNLLLNPRIKNQSSIECITFGCLPIGKEYSTKITSFRDRFTNYIYKEDIIPMIFWQFRGGTCSISHHTLISEILKTNYYDNKKDLKENFKNLFEKEFEVLEKSNLIHFGKNKLVGNDDDNFLNDKNIKDLYASKLKSQLNKIQEFEYEIEKYFIKTYKLNESLTNLSDCSFVQILNTNIKEEIMIESKLDKNSNSLIITFTGKKVFLISNVISNIEKGVYLYDHENTKILELMNISKDVKIIKLQTLQYFHQTLEFEIDLSKVDTFDLKETKKYEFRNMEIQELTNRLIFETFDMDFKKEILFPNCYY